LQSARLVVAVQPVDTREPTAEEAVAAEEEGSIHPPFSGGLTAAPVPVPVPVRLSAAPAAVRSIRTLAMVQ
jgi:hypothetical protein